MPEGSEGLLLSGLLGERVEESFRMRLSPAKESMLPRLYAEGYRVTSPETWDYNCIAHAADEQDVWWWPDANGDAYWPDGIKREETLEAFVAAYGSLGYEECSDYEHEEGFQKVAIYTNGKDIPTHAAKLLPTGKWTSKLGPAEDIEHETLTGVCGPVYGKVAKILKRPI